MLELKQIKKDYKMGDEVVAALKGVDMSFGENEFVAILGPSGCGKTTLLNIIGGLDQYSDGDLIINGVSTKKYKSADWDAYRNNSIGFVFQSYQLIPHQTVLSNVELTMTLSGISKKERRKCASEALARVGLGDQLKKKPNQMSGGQMQRAAIARALVNTPDIILADEPTGALDTETSVQIMDILKEVSKDHLVIMVTHNPELAETYATRIVRLQDGLVVSDTEKPAEEEAKLVEVEGAAVPKMQEEPKKETKSKKKSMSFWTALSLSLNNLMTKKGRTFLTAFAGAIGIIGIALILATSTGVQNYIDNVESDTLSQYPLQINRETVDFSEMMQSMTAERDNKEDKDAPITEVRSNNMMSNFITGLANDRTENDMRAFKKFVETDEELAKYIRTAEYSYSTVLNVFRTDGETLIQANPSAVMDKMGMTGQTSGSMLNMLGSAYDVFDALPDNREMTEQMYEVLDGRFPENYDEIAIAVTERGRFSDYTLYSLGLYDQNELKKMMQDAMLGKEIGKKEAETFSFDTLKSMKFSVLPNPLFYEKLANGTYEDRSDNLDYIGKMLETDGIPLKITGIVRVKNGMGGLALYGGIVYTPALMRELISRIDKTDIVMEQKENPDTDVFTGIAFPKEDEEEKEPTMADLEAYMATLPEEQRMAMQGMIAGMKAAGATDADIVKSFGEYLNRKTDATYDGNLSILGVQDPENPSAIRLYPLDFEAKDQVTRILDEYSDSLGEGRELKYTDYVGRLMSSITKIINVITYILIGFVGVSLVVSSIMIGIITYISVMERTREIGILRSIGASKRDIARVFNAETLIVGFISGLIGIAIPYAVSIFVNAIVYREFGVQNIMYLSPFAAVALVIISMLLTLIGGLIPSGIASRKDPVEALRTE